MSIIQFSHANGFPAKTYSILFEHLPKHQISTVEILGRNEKPPQINWHDLTEEVLESVRQCGESVVGVGHSLGGILTLLAAAKQPELFQSVVLLDPPLFSSWKRGLIRMLRFTRTEDWFSPSGKSKKRRACFESKEQALAYFQSREMFRNFHPQALQDYVTHGLTSGTSGSQTYAELAIPVETEMAIFHNLLTSYPPSVYEVRGTLVYAAKNPIFWPSDFRWLKHNFPNLQVCPFPGPHLFPMEFPESTARLIERCLENCL